MDDDPADDLAHLVMLMQSMSSLPLFLFALPAGALADIVDRRRSVLGAQITCLLVAASLGLIVATGHLASIDSGNG